MKAFYIQVSKYVWKGYSNHRKNTIGKHLNFTRGNKKAYMKLQSHKTWIEGLYDADAQNTTFDRKEKLHIATNFYENLYSAPVCQDIIPK